MYFCLANVINFSPNYLKITIFCFYYYCNRLFYHLCKLILYILIVFEKKNIGKFLYKVLG